MARSPGPRLALTSSNLVVDQVFVARDVVPGAEDADGSGEAGQLLHLRQQESVGRVRMLFVVDEQIALGDAVAELHDFEVEAVQADALVAVLAEDQRLAVFELDDVLAAGVFFGEIDPGAVVEDVAVLQDFDVGRAFVRGGLFQSVFQVLLEDVHRARDEVASAPIASEMGLNGRSAVPNGVDLVFLPNSEVGEYWPLVRP